MKEFKNVILYDWVDFFKSISTALDLIGQNRKNRNHDLKEKAKNVFGEGHAIYTYSEIDPFSFIYTLAQRNTTNQKKSVFQSCIDVFELETKLPTDWYFPTPTPQTKSLFYNKGKYADSNGNTFSVDILWDLFSDVVNDKNLDENNFKDVLSIVNVGVVKFTQTLFLINAKKFLPIDERTTGILTNSINPTKEIKKLGLPKYQEFLNFYKKTFPECYPYEINLFLSQFTGNGKQIPLKKGFCQVSTMVDGQNKKDYYDDFIRNNAVRAGSSGEHKTRGGEYPLEKVFDGDVVLVRRGTKNMAGIGVIIDNEYLEDGYDDDKAIKIVWINKSQRKLNNALGDWTGFNLATDNTIRKIKEVYTDTFDLIDSLTSPNNNTVENKNTINNMTNNNLNQILYGPPGTGKTHRLKNEFFDKFTLKKPSLSREQFLEFFASEMNWWQIISVVVYDLESAKVNDIYDHELVKVKEKLSNSRTVTSTIWEQLQRHTTLDCKNVNVKIKDRSEPLYFSKDEKSNWTIDSELLKQYYPKAFEILDYIQNFTGNEDIVLKNYDLVTFHQSFSYEDFIEGIKPKLEDGETELNFEIKDGIFKKICLKAEANPNNNYAIFIDEINRGNVSAIFGELITLIEEDKRLGAKNELKIKLPYSKSEFGVPSNLYIIGTMNTADRSVEALDTALRRRFCFVEMMPDLEVVSGKNFTDYDRVQIMKKINQRIELLLDRNYTLGHSYFIKEDFTNSFKDEIIPLLQEYFYNDCGKIGLILGRGFVREKEISKNNNASLFADFDTKNEVDIIKSYEIIPFDEIDFKIAIETLLA
ncbi:McrB family protein [Flavobacterium piscisymbiosum]|uniref:AAA family ATPase n=1 Tax=Flavobacterium piscisymbiosum TaxID=2893753 RepID=A0ABS8MLS5_9FLAO|nr:AAA family ATPase [Flavobacterium sp. F-30]MCC9066459.1 AAA family ATPase [Flavobacterium sp. F-30]